MKVRRLLKHAVASHWATRRLFPRETLHAIEKAVTKAEQSHSGEIRFAIETSMPPALVWKDVSARTQAMSAFAHLRVWDTERNNGVLLYLQLADRKVEIIADRGFVGRVSAAEWEAVCRLMEQQFRARRFREGSIAGIEAVGNLIARHFPSEPGARNELPNQPALL
jgi:uncharacterized membrane protein